MSETGASTQLRPMYVPTAATYLRRMLIAAAVLLLAAAIAYFGISAYVADRFSVPKRVLPSHTPADVGLRYETVHFTSSVDQIPLTGWFVDAPGENVVLLMHGRDATMDDETLQLLPLMQRLYAQSYKILAYDPRGHGLSGGKRYSFGDLETRDLDGALEYLKTRGLNEAFVLSYSLGAATALNAAGRHPEMRAIVADSSFADVGMIVEGALPRAAGLPSFFTPGLFTVAQLSYGMDFWHNKPANALAQLGDRPVFLIHATGDPEVPTSHHYMLLKAAGKNPNVESWLIQGSDHCHAFRDNPDEYMRRIVAFYQKHSD